MARKKYQKTYHYTCSLTGETFVTTKEAENPEELISVRAHYQLNPELDDRPMKYQLMDKEILEEEEGEQEDKEN